MSEPAIVVSEAKQETFPAPAVPELVKKRAAWISSISYSDRKFMGRLQQMLLDTADRMSHLSTYGKVLIDDLDKDAAGVVSFMGHAVTTVTKAHLPEDKMRPHWVGGKKYWKDAKMDVTDPEPVWVNFARAFSPTSSDREREWAMSYARAIYSFVKDRNHRDMAAQLTLYSTLLLMRDRLKSLKEQTGEIEHVARQAVFVMRLADPIEQPRADYDLHHERWMGELNREVEVARYRPMTPLNEVRPTQGLSVIKEMALTAVENIRDRFGQRIR